MPRNRVTGPGGYNSICDVCGFKYKASELMKRWDGLMVCKWDWEPRHPQQFIKNINDQPNLPFVRPDSDGIDVSPALNCDGLVESIVDGPVFNLMASEPLTVYKMKVITFGVPVSITDTTTVLCTLIIE